MANTASVHVYREGDHDEFSVEDYIVGERGAYSTVSTLAREQGDLADGVLADHQETPKHRRVVERAAEEDPFVAKISVPFWFRQDDDEVRETWGDQDRITALVEDYSDKAWRVIAKRPTGPWGGYTYEWTFVPKSLATVITVDAEGRDHADATCAAAFEAHERSIERDGGDGSSFDSWEEAAEQMG